MSTLPENELDLEKLFLPSWAQEPASAKHYAQYEGGAERPERRGQKGERRPFRRPEGSNDRPRGDRPRGDRRGPPGSEGGRKPFGQDRAPFRRDEPRERREPLAPLPEINVSFIPDERGVESLARQIKTTGRAYPLFDIARLILQKPERYSVAFSVKKKPDGAIAQPLFLCALDETLWLSEDEAVAHVLRKHFATFYQAEQTPTEPPKGKYTFVAQCGMSGVILGPPNYHDYQNQLRKLHAERFSRMPFDAFKSRVKIVRDEEVVKKWIEDQSSRTEFVCLNLPEPLRLGSREAVEKHFREAHKDNIVKAIEAQTCSGTAARALPSRELARLAREAWEDQRRFPLQLATLLSQQFAGHGLQFFKVNKAITHVSVARPRFLDLETTPVSDGIRRIVEYVNARPKCNRRHLFEALAPTPSPTVVPPTGGTSGGEKSPESGTPIAGAESASAPTEPPSPPAQPSGPTTEQTAVIADLHWLIHQGHVIEFANGIIETAKKPLPRPPKPEAKPAAEPAGTQPVETAPAAASAATVETAAPAASEVEQTGTADSAAAGSEAIQTGADVPGPADATQAAPQPESETDAAPAESHS